MAEEAAPSTPEGGQAPAEQQDARQERTFTQAELDQQIAKRLERQKAQFAGFDDIKAKAEQFDKLQAERQTEAEKLLAAIDKANTKAQEAGEREQQAMARANDIALRAEVIRAAAAADAAHPEDIVALLPRSSLTVTAEGDVQGVDEAVQKFLEDRPEYRRQRGAAGFDGGARQTAQQGPSINDQIRTAAGFAPR